MVIVEEILGDASQYDNKNSAIALMVSYAYTVFITTG